MLIAVVLKIIPTEFTLEYNRRNVDKKLSPDINDFLEFFQAEIESKERTCLMKPEFDTTSLYINSKKNKFKPLNKVQARTSTYIDALFTDQISVANIPPPELNNIPQTVHLENLVLADSPDCQEPITILIGADYYYDVVTGKIKHLSKKLVAVETIFGWCLQGRNSENQTSLALSVIVQEKLISDQLKKFWDLEVTGVIDTKQEFEVSENQIIKNFESNIKYDEKSKRYRVKLPWKSEARELKDNREIAEKRYTRLRKLFQ
ncbi:integrase catalytic domain-containing protein [Trichonephila clavata]|uniref:Integrase catalytic domain-containing protein n=1 Tax=Trichonephila clavata TaxID=2740835 RepID=A0A8X6G095_TRICU|nr:integrase catalytic domain-containing protein [Trichonephila clavata]